MGNTEGRSCTAFEGVRRIASGELQTVALAAKEVLDRGETGPVLIFDDVTSRIVEVDFRGTPEEVRKRLEVTASADRGPEASGPNGDTNIGDTAGAIVPADEPAAAPAGPRGRGRPRLGVVAREVTLLPRHWEWLGTQPGGASVTLRKLVEAARRSGGDRDRVRVARESAYRFMNAMAGNEAGYEEAVRALYAGDAGRFEEMVAGWPEDVRERALVLAKPGLAAG